MNKDKSFLYAVRFDFESNQFEILDTWAWIGEPVRDHDSDESRSFDSLSEEAMFCNVENLLGASISATNKILVREEVRVAVDKAHAIV